MITLFSALNEWTFTMDAHKNYDELTLYVEKQKIMMKNHKITQIYAIFFTYLCSEMTFPTLKA